MGSRESGCGEGEETIKNGSKRYQISNEGGFEGGWSGRRLTIDSGVQDDDVQAIPRSIVKVSPLLVRSVASDKKECQCEVGISR
jgi:hypothetical protein